MPLFAAVCCAGILLLMAAGAAQRPAKAQDGGQSEIRRGLEIAPVPLNLNGKNVALVALGSYIVNANSDCNACHTWANWAAGGNPYLGQPARVNTAGYLAGGRPFNPPGVISADITPWENGMPAGLTLDQFKNALRTGHDPDGSGRLLQIMPWPYFANMTDRDLEAIYEYLKAIPPIQPGPGAG